MKDTSKLLDLYHQTSKHSNYQIVASNLENYIGNDAIDVTSRYEKERLKYFLENVNVKGKSIVDIGGNTGYFTFELLKAGAAKANYYEGNKVHALFVKEASSILDLQDRLNVHNEYFLFDNSMQENHDVIFLLNVLHHVGDDYGDEKISKEKALETITQSLKNLASKTDTLIFQLGFNWKGDRHLPLFENGTKKEMIDFIVSATKDIFEIIDIGIAEKIDDTIVYKPMSDTNLQRYDELGEFLNRPIFVMKSKVK